LYVQFLFGIYYIYVYLECRILLNSKEHIFRKAQNGIFSFLLHRPRGSIIISYSSVSRKQRERELRGQGSGGYVQDRTSLNLSRSRRFSRVASQNMTRYFRRGQGGNEFFPASFVGDRTRTTFPTRNRYAAVLATACGNVRFTAILIYINNNNYYSRVAEEKPGAVRFPLRKQRRFAPLQFISVTARSSSG